jgi:Uri superfamily endonuclease
VWSYVFESGVWSIFGLAVGVLIGRMERQVEDIKRKVDHIDHP